MTTPTYAKSIYTSATGTTDTKYTFSDGETWTVDNHTGRRRVAYQDFEGDNMHRGTLAMLDYRIKAAEQVGETETLESPATSTSEPLDGGTITAHELPFAMRWPALDGDMVLQGHADYCAKHGHAEHFINTVETGRCPRCGELHNGDTSRARTGGRLPVILPALDPELPVLDAVEIPETAHEEPETDEEKIDRLEQELDNYKTDMRELDTAAGHWRESYLAERDRADKADRELAIALLKIRELEADLADAI